MASAVYLSNLKILSGNQSKDYESIFKKVDMIIREVELQSESQNLIKASENKNEALEFYHEVVENPSSSHTNSISVTKDFKETGTASPRPKFGLKSYQYRNLDEVASFLPQPSNINNSNCSELLTLSEKLLPISISTNEPASCSNNNIHNKIGSYSGSGIRIEDQDIRLRNIKSWRQSLISTLQKK